MVFDSHLDTPSELLRGRDMFSDKPDQQVDLAKMQKGGVQAAFFALYTSAETEPDAATKHAMEMAGAVETFIRHAGGPVAWAFSPADVRKNLASGKMSILLGMENGSPIQNSMDLLSAFYHLGVRYMTLTHNGDNAIADSAAEGKRWGGLSPFGREVVAEMNRLGMMVDLSHASDRTFWDCITLSKAPVVATHSCCRALCSHRRSGPLQRKTVMSASISIPGSWWIIPRNTDRVSGKSLIISTMPSGFAAMTMSESEQTLTESK